MERLEKWFCIMHFHDAVNTTDSILNSLKKYEISNARLAILLFEFNETMKAVLKLMFITVSGRSTNIPDAEGNMAGVMEVLPKLINSHVYLF